MGRAGKVKDTSCSKVKTEIKKKVRNAWYAGRGGWTRVWHYGKVKGLFKTTCSKDKKQNMSFS